MRILWVKADKLLPVHSGGNIRSYHIMRSLSAQHELTFFSYYGGHRDESYERELSDRLPGSVAICTGKRDLQGAIRGVDYLFRFPNRAPYAVSRFASYEVQDRLRAWFREKRFDVTVCDFLDAAVNFPGKLGVPSVLFQHNVESEIWRRHALTESHPLKRVMYKIEFQKMLRYEQVMIRKFQHVIAVSENDRELMNQWVDGSRVTVVPTGVDLQQYKPSPARESASPLVVFVGAMDWEPNVDGVEYFCSQIWPKVLAEVPDAQFRIVGRNPDKRVQKWACNTVQVTGRVPSVVDHLRDAAAVIVPLRIGGGTRLKIYEAMATGRAVVSTTIGAEGLDVHHGEDVVLADEPERFAQAVVMLLKDPKERLRFEGAAAATAARYDWPAIGERFSDVLARVAGNEMSAALPEAVPALGRGNS
jgi:glycosyltransferase involved in cell wall biosynthesis